jgi:DNA-binding response OmpR family regulator
LTPYDARQHKIYGVAVRILLVEDDTMIAEAAQAGLKQDSFAVDWVRSGEAALDAVALVEYDVVLLDLGLPKMSGLDVLTQLRSRAINTPVVIISARDQIADRVKGLNLGADDYLTKPFDLCELSARIVAVTRRTRGRANNVLIVGDIEVDTDAKRVTLQGNDVLLTAREYAIFLCLLQRLNHIVSKRQLHDAVYAWADDIESNTMEVYIHQLRKKLGADTIKTIRGMGYSITGTLKS